MSFFSGKNPVFHIGFNEQLMQSFYELFKNMNMAQLALRLNIDYSIFRKMFKEYTGISPGQYHLSLRIRQAKDLLINTNLSIKEISYRLGFESIFYFSRVFKSKTGINPTGYKNGPVKWDNSTMEINTISTLL